MENKRKVKPNIFMAAKSIQTENDAKYKKALELLAKAKDGLWVHKSKDLILEIEEFLVNNPSLDTIERRDD